PRTPPIRDELLRPMNDPSARGILVASRRDRVDLEQGADVREYNVVGSQFLRIALDRAGMPRERLADLLGIGATRIRNYCSLEHAATISLGKILAMREKAPSVYAELM